MTVIWLNTLFGSIQKFSRDRWFFIFIRSGSKYHVYSVINEDGITIKVLQKIKINCYCLFIISLVKNNKYK